MGSQILDPGRHARTILDMRRLLFGICAAATLVACAAEPAAEPLTLDQVATADEAVLDQVTGPVVSLGSVPPSTEPTYQQPPDDVVPGATPGGLGDLGIGDFCADHLEPARALLEEAEARGSMPPDDLAVVQATLDTALENCTPSEYFAFQEAVFSYLDSTTSTPAESDAIDSTTDAD